MAGRKSARTLFALALVVLQVAALRRSAAATGPYFEVRGGVSSYALDHINEAIAEVNADLDLDYNGHLNLIQNGPAAAIGIGLHLGNGWAFGVAAEKLWAGSRTNFQPIGPGVSLQAEYSTPATAGLVELMAPLLRPEGSGHVFGGLGARLGVGAISPDGFAEIRGGTTKLRTEMWATSPIAELSVLSTWRMSRIGALTCSVGYRAARISSAEFQTGSIKYQVDDTPLDYSGIYVTAGVQIAAQ